MKKKHQAAIFDMDGTLLDSMPFWQQLAPDFLKRNNLAVPENLAGKLSEVNIHQAVDIILDEFDLPMTHNAVYSEFIATATDYYRNQVKFKPGAERFLQKLQTCNIATLLFTSSPENLAAWALERLDSKKYFTYGILSCETLQKSKSDPGVFSVAADKLKLPPSEIMVFEDALYAAVSAKQVGFSLTAIFDNAETDSVKMHELADFYIKNSFDEFPVDAFF